MIRLIYIDLMLMKFYNLIKAGCLLALLSSKLLADGGMSACQQPMPDILSCYTVMFTVDLTKGTGFISDSTITPHSLNKKIVRAKPDALAYIASNGAQYHSAYLEAGFQALRNYYPKASNLQLAEVIVAF